MAAFNILVRRYSRTAVTLALAHTSSADAAEDVAQEALIRAWTALGSCGDPDRFGSWLSTIIRRTALNMRTKLDRRRQMRDRFAPEVAAGSASTSQTPVDQQLANELDGVLASAIEMLAPRQREVLLLHDLEGRSHGEIGELLEITASTSRKHLSDARSRVREQLTMSHPQGGNNA